MINIEMYYYIVLKQLYDFQPWEYMRKKHKLSLNAKKMFYHARLKKLSLLKDHILFEYVNNLLFAVLTYFNLGGFVLNWNYKVEN